MGQGTFFTATTALCEFLGSKCLTFRHCLPIGYYVRQGIADGLYYLHAQGEKGVIHRDLKCANVLMDGAVPKVSDFGLARALDNSRLATRSTAVGTLRWNAPEQLLGNFSKKSDVYSFAMVIYEIATLKVPFDEKDDPEILSLLNKSHFVVDDDILDLCSAEEQRRRWDKRSRKTFEARRPDCTDQNFPMDCPTQIKTLMKSCWKDDPEDRPDFEFILSVLGRNSIPTVLNQPGKWDVFISHSRRSAKSTTLAMDILNGFKDRGLKCW